MGDRDEHESGDGRETSRLANILTSAAQVAIGVSPIAAVSLTGFRRLQDSPVRRLKKRLKEQIGNPADSPIDALETIVAESDLRSYEWRIIGTWWGRSYYLLGAPAAIIGAAAGGTALSNAVSNAIVGVLALVAAGLTTLVTFLNSDQNRNRCVLLSAEWANLGGEARLSLLRYANAAKLLQSADMRTELQDVENEVTDTIMKLNQVRSELFRREVFDRGGQSFR